jgi:hypothetical protein
LAGERMSCSNNCRASDRGRIGVFYAFKTPKRIGDDVGDSKYVFTKKNHFFFVGGIDQPDTFYPPYYARI